MRYGLVSSCSRVVFIDNVSVLKRSSMLGCSHFSTFSLVFVYYWQQGQRSEFHAPMIFIISPVPQNQLTNFIAPSLVPRGIYFMALSIPYQFIRSKYLLDIWPLYIRKSLACVCPMWFLTNFESKPDILRGIAMQCHSPPWKLLTVI